MAGPEAIPPDRHPPGTPDRRDWTRYIIAAVAAVLGIVFIALNTAKVRVHFIFFTVTTRLWIGLLVCLVLGALLGQALGSYRRRAKSHRSSGGRAAA